jgi:hypothetical protein
VVDLYAALGQQLLHVPVGQAEAQVPTDRKDDHVRRNRNPANADRGGRGTQTRRRAGTGQESASPSLDAANATVSPAGLAGAPPWQVANIVTAGRLLRAGPA